MAAVVINALLGMIGPVKGASPPGSPAFTNEIQHGPASVSKPARTTSRARQKIAIPVGMAAVVINALLGMVGPVKGA